MSVKALPVLTEPKFDPSGSSAEVDRRVKDLLRDALSVYRVDPEKLRAAAPDVIVTQSQCDVCAVSMREVEEAVAEWTGKRPRLVSLAPYSLADVLADMERVATALDVPEDGSELTRRIRRRMEAVEARARTAPTRPAVAMIEWIEPLMAAANWMPELIVMAGATNLFGRAGEHSPWMKFDELAGADPEIIIVAPCGFDMERTAAEIQYLQKQPGWHELKSVREGRVFLAEGNQYFNRPGPRIAESLEILAEIVHPEIFHFGYEGSGFRRLV